MGCHPHVKAALIRALRATEVREQQDKLLDQWWRLSALATEFDADLWGFPKQWMAEELRQLTRR